MLEGVSGPVNVIANPRTGSAAGALDRLQELGVHRVTFGGGLQHELVPEVAKLLAPWANRRD